MKNFYTTSWLCFVFFLTTFFSCKNEPVEFTPVAKFSILKIENEEAEFKNTSVNATSYHWDFGDGNTSTEKDPTHSYAEVGDFTVVLTAMLDNQSNQTSQIVPITRVYPEELTELTRPTFGPRSEGLSFTYNGKAYVGFGTSNFQLVNDLWEYNPDNNVWTKLADGPKSFILSAGFEINGELYMGVGQSPWGNGAKEFYKYNIASDTYTSIGSIPIVNNFNQNWVDAIGFSFQEKGYLIGSDGQFNSETSVLEFNPVDLSWIEKSIYPGTSISGLFDFMIDGNLYIGMGGENSFNSNNTSQDVWKYDVINNDWTQMSDFPGEGRKDAIGFTYNGKGYLAFGNQREISTGAINVFPELWEYNVNNDQWTKIESMPIPIAKHPYYFILENKFLSLIHI